MMQKCFKITETLRQRYSSESTQREQSNEYQHDKVWMAFKNLDILVLWTRVASTLDGLTIVLPCRGTFMKILFFRYWIVLENSYSKS